MVKLVNKDAIADLYSAFNVGSAGFYLITASAYMHRQIANSFITENVAVYDYSGKENTDIFSPKELFDFIENNNEKEEFFILNFHIPFLGKQPETTQPDYFALNLCRDVLSAYNKKIFFFTTKEIEHNISISAMDFFDYFFPKIDFEDEKRDEIERQIVKLGEDYDKIHHNAEIVYRLNLYKDKTEEYLNIKGKMILHHKNKKTENYLLVAARDLHNFAALYEKVSNFEKALELYYKALYIREKKLGKEHISTATTYNNIASVYYKQGYYPDYPEKALVFYKKALEIREKVLGKEHLETATTYNKIAVVYNDQGDCTKALEFCEKALKIREKVLGKEHPETAVTYSNIAATYHNQGDYSKALEYYQKALKIQEKVLGNEHLNVAKLYDNIGGVYDSQGDYSKTLEYLYKALKIRKKVLGDNHHYTVDTYNAIEEIKKTIS